MRAPSVGLRPLGPSPHKPSLIGCTPTQERPPHPLLRSRRTHRVGQSLERQAVAVPLDDPAEMPERRKTLVCHHAMALAGAIPSQTIEGSFGASQDLPGLRAIKLHLSEIWHSALRADRVSEFDRAWVPPRPAAAHHPFGGHGQPHRVACAARGSARVQDLVLRRGARACRDDPRRSCTVSRTAIAALFRHRPAHRNPACSACSSPTATTAPPATAT
jgi:hypothetical protein